MKNHTVNQKHSINTYTAAGVMLLSAGLIMAMDRFLETGWLTFLIFPLIGIGMIAIGMVEQRRGWLVAGSLTLGVGVAIFCLLAGWLELPSFQRIGWACLSFGSCWLLMGLLLKLVGFSSNWWVLIPASVILAPAVMFISERVDVLGFVFYSLTFLGLAFLSWGLGQKLIGLIIPGSLLVSIGPGIYFSWSPDPFGNGLTQTGMMLVWFAFGWGMITIFSRRINSRFAWWPLIPGGILAVTGWGLYIGGDPSNALGFIGNTGSIGIMIFGLYLLLMRRGLHR
jgi:hypothetical protein